MTGQGAIPDRYSPTPTTARWGHAIRGKRHGFLVVPHALLRYQKRLKLTDGEMLVAMNVLMHWSVSEPENLPFIPAHRIAKRMGASARTVQRHISSLERKGYLYRLPPEPTTDGPVRRRMDLTGLVNAVRWEAGETPDDGGDSATPQNADSEGGGTTLGAFGNSRSAARGG